MLADPKTKRLLQRYGAAVVAVALGALVAFLSSLQMKWGVLGLLAFPFAVLASASYGGLGPGLFATTLSGLVVAFAFATPIGSFAVESLRDQIALSVLIMTSATQSAVVGAHRLHRHALESVNATLQKSVEMYRLLFENCPEPTLFFEVGSRKIVAANWAAETTYDYSRDELVGMRVDALFAPGAEIAFLAELAGEANGDGSEAKRWRHVTKNGSPRDVEARWARIVWPGGVAVLFVGRDVTRRVRAEERLLAASEELRRAKARAEHANETKDRFIRALSHELRTPLTPVLLTITALERRADLPESAREAMQRIRRNVLQEVKLIDELLDTSRIADGTFTAPATRTELRPLIESAIVACRGAATARGLSFEWKYDATSDAVLADAARLEQLIRALITNAISWSRDGGVVRVWTRDADRDRVQVGVMDSGAGLTKEELARIFLPFERIEGSSAGRTGELGLALPIGKSAVEASGGKLTATSEGPGMGSTFVIELRVAPRSTTDPDPSNAGAEEPAPLRILFVEDDADTRDAAARLLTSLGHDVSAVGTATEALAVARAGSYDLLISDLGLPDLSGVELMTRVRALSAMRGIALSGFGAENDVRASLAAGFRAHLTKPVSADELTAAIQRAMA